MNFFLTQLPLLMGVPETSGTPANASGQLLTTFFTFGLVILIFYFLIIRPQNKKKKEAQTMLSALKKGDRVATIGGIRGIVQAVKEETIVLKVDDNTKIEFTKSAVSTVLERKESKKESSKADKAEAAASESEEEEEVEDQDQ